MIVSLPGISTRRGRLRSLLLLLCALSAMDSASRPAVAQNVIHVCHGYGCWFRASLVLDAADTRRFAAILARGRRSPAAERAAISDAVRHFERRAFDVIGIRDEPRSRFGASGEPGQMDCIDESTNTRALLLYLAEHDLLRHHTVRSVASRGFLIDGRYFHSTAVIRDTGGTDWAVDSWYAPMGGAPDILPLSEWRVQGLSSQDARRRTG
ncbi:hypothetical protein IMF23_18740 [Chelatococcus daeguensis]|uniref:DUF2380 domain-containing protein n=3 Tax=Chelatococcaceae TaxID=2036754 RepID=A0AAC9NYJ4_9HYPH|nr:hypothetical protein BOQ54_09575 [Chelatococcus daeguensis]KZE35483.1 hypothetical protein AVW15_14665 [Chelatococcus daeguensis]MBM3085481.1 hypothetical protein [Chelatococcus daeguensis]CUA86133.1 hypothetical protein Ga0061061_102383 [Chelatococcus sambhunathii]